MIYQWVYRLFHWPSHAELFSLTIACQVEMGSLNMSVVELDEPRHVRHIANLIQEIQFKRDLLQVIAGWIVISGCTLNQDRKKFPLVPCFFLLTFYNPLPAFLFFFKFSLFINQFLKTWKAKIFCFHFCLDIFLIFSILPVGTFSRVSRLLFAVLSIHR